MVPVHPRLGLTPLRLKAATLPSHSLPNFRAGRVSPPLVLWEGGCRDQGCFAQVGNNRSKTEFEHKLVSTQSKAMWHPAQE